MKTLAWATDTHFDFVNDEVLVQFVQFISSKNPDAILLTGDISNGMNLIRHLRALDRLFQIPVYFVLGNHDIWGSSFEDKRAAVSSLTTEHKNLFYLSNFPYISLSKRTALVGHDGWYDALYGSSSYANVLMNDWHRITDFTTVGAWNHVSPGVNFGALVSFCRKLAYSAATHVTCGIDEAVEAGHDTIIIATHIPPFEEAHASNKPHGMNVVPWYTSKIMGDALLNASEKYPRVRFEIFCGHTHAKRDVVMRSNLGCHVGHSTYSDPQLQALIQVP